ncbi:hypothetical protein PAN31117_04639 [Pandoraea anapnoica]|uniref:Uncharacterized protein n=1 Tax=Pandoraea anapnoica TaxID=2508301 RepID=A0A5E5AM52_9BURK|nr:MULTISPECIES: hypothetical protein [Pandoraea]VVE42539.1 hypothetical protein PIN31009_04195 [Pandoraea iniqua]VVE73170.1 hypothetical protein PAN31117_04639 [Pandoraea anapnoica]
MDVQQLVSEFMTSELGKQARQALISQGVNADDAQKMLGHATDVAHAGTEEQSSSWMGDHAGKSFFAAFAAGLVRGDGFLKSLEGGGAGMLTGRVAQALANRMGIDSATASTVAAAATPYIVSFMKEKFA